MSTQGNGSTCCHGIQSYEVRDVIWQEETKLYNDFTGKGKNKYPIANNFGINFFCCEEREADILTRYIRDEADTNFLVGLSIFDTVKTMEIFEIEIENKSYQILYKPFGWKRHPGEKVRKKKEEEEAQNVVTHEKHGNCLVEVITIPCKGKVMSI